MYSISRIIATIDLWLYKKIYLKILVEVIKMIFSEKLQLIRKSKGITQENLAMKINVSRQAVAKWESGQSYPDITNLLQISDLFHITVDYLVRDADCSIKCIKEESVELSKLVDFRIETSKNTYAGFLNETEPTRQDSHDYTYSNGDYTYHDTYVGGEKFAGEETICYKGKAKYAMNYIGHVLGEHFNGDFLKEALRMASHNMPYRGPEFYQDGEYIYKCNVVGDFAWFQGCEEITCNNVKVYECFFHGGLME